MRKEESLTLNLALRYSALILIGILGNAFFYFFFTAITIYPVFFLLKLFFNASMISNVLVVNHLPIEIIGSCIAGSAYYLLLILNLSIPDINIKKRVKIMLFSFLSLLVLNILRIFSLSLLFVSGNSFFDITHKFFWYIGSTIFVDGIWFLSVKLFKIKGVPFYSDIKFLASNSRKRTGKIRKSKKRH